MSKFEIGKIYKDQSGQEYTFLNEDKGIGIFKLRNAEKKFRIIEQFGSISLACGNRYSNQEW
jgi:hypothetical protein